MRVIESLSRPLAILFALGTTASVAQTVQPVVPPTQTPTTPVALPTPSPPQPAPSPGPPPPPVDCMPGPFIVFFSWGKADIDREAAEILDNAVTIAKGICGPIGEDMILTAGFADRSGPTRHNLALSRRRAEAVKAYFVAHGIAAKLILTQAFGEDPRHLRKETPDGDADRQNRRVEISYAPPPEHWGLTAAESGNPRRDVP